MKKQVSWIAFLTLLCGVAHADLPEGVSPLEQAAQTPVFESLLGSASHYAIGAAAHGTREFEEIRVFLLKYLIEKRGVRNLYFEANFSESKMLDDLVQPGHDCAGGDWRLALRKFYWFYFDYDRPDFEKFARWVCRFNQAHATDPVHLSGTEARDPWAESKVLGSYLSQYLPAEASALIARVNGSCFGARFETPEDFLNSPETKDYVQAKRLPDALYQDCLKVTEEAGRLLEAREVQLLAASGSEAFWRARIAARLLARSEESYQWIFWDFKRAESSRDESMAWTLLHANEGYRDGGASVYVAHNLHMGKATSELEPLDFGWRGVRSAGEWLAEVWGSQFKAIGLSGYEIQTKQGIYPLPDSPMSLDLKLSAFGEKPLLVDPHAGWIRAQGKWFLHEEDLKNGVLIEPEKNFDVLVFIRRVSPGASN